MKHKLFLFLAVLCASSMMRAEEEFIVRQYTDTVIRTLTDTVVITEFIPDSIAKQREVVIPTDSTDRRGHYVEAHVGLGYGSLGYNLVDPYCHTNGSFSALLQAQYAYFFTPNWGIGAGLWFTNYTTFARLDGTFIWNGVTDTDFEQNYNHNARVVRWKERETIHNLGIPVSVQFQYEKDDWKARLFAELGIAPSFVVSKKYKVLDGEIAHSGYYPNWNLWLTDVHEFGPRQYANTGEMSVRPQVAIFADLGALLPLTKQIDLFLGGYFNCALNDANSSAKKALGWRDDTFTFMETYDGAYATTLANASHPWEAGIKVGIHWHYIKPDKHEMEDYFEPFMREQTRTEYKKRQDTILIARADTIVPEHIQQVAEEVEKFNKIYFAFDKYYLTNKAKNYLNSIIEALNKVPDAQIMLDGHASSEGQSEYNDILSENRARTVRNYLISRGVDKSRIVTAGHGSRMPNEDTEYEEMSRDRRVEIKVVYNNNVVIEQ